MAVADDRPRKRDPHRRESILNAAASLLARRGTMSVSMAEIGADVGIAASAIYWHFPSKQALLIALFDRSLDGLLEGQTTAIAAHGATSQALDEIIRRQVDFVVSERSFALIYYQASQGLPAEDLGRLRQRQRRYIENWSALLRDLDPVLGEPASVALVHAAIGAIQSPLVYKNTLPEPRLAELLVKAAWSILAPATASSLPQ